MQVRVPILRGSNGGHPYKKREVCILARKKSASEGSNFKRVKGWASSTKREVCVTTYIGKESQRSLNTKGGSNGGHCHLKKSYLAFLVLI